MPKKKDLLTFEKAKAEIQVGDPHRWNRIKTFAGIVLQEENLAPRQERRIERLEKMVSRLPKDARRPKGRDPHIEGLESEIRLWRAAQGTHERMRKGDSKRKVPSERTRYLAFMVLDLMEGGHSQHRACALLAAVLPKIAAKSFPRQTTTPNLLDVTFRNFRKANPHVERQIERNARP